MLEMDVREASPHPMWGGGAELTAVEHGVRAALTSLGVRENVELGASVEQCEHVEFLPTRRCEKTRTSGVVQGTPEALTNGVLTAVILAPSRDKHALRALGGDCGSVTIFGVKHILVVGVESKDVNTDSPSLPEHFGERSRRFGLVL